MEERNVITDGVNTIEDIENRKAYPDAVREAFPGLFSAIRESEKTEEREPDKTVVVKMMEQDIYVRKAIDKKLAELKEKYPVG